MLKLISLNIELNKHFERNIPFFRNEVPDVLCLQEVFEKDLDMIRKETGMDHILYAPMSFVPYSSPASPLPHPYGLADQIAAGKIPREQYELEEVGIAILSRTPFIDEDIFYYWKPEHGISVHDSAHRRDSEGRLLLTVKVEKEGKVYRIGTSHFTWSAEGQATLEQQEDAEKLLERMKSFGDLVCCGDFNIPRGGEIFHMFTSEFKDNIPHEIQTTLDKKYHRNGELNFVVDVLLTTPEYSAKHVRIVDDVSDHMAVVAEIESI